MTYTLQKKGTLYKQYTGFTKSEVLTGLRDLAIAIRVLKKHPEALEEFKTALTAARRSTPSENYDSKEV